MDNNYNNDPNNYGGGQNNGGYPDNNDQYGGQNYGGYPDNNGQYNGQNYGNYPNNGQYYNNVPNFYNQLNDPYARPQYEEPDGKAIAALVLGLCNLIAWCIPLFGFPCGIVGLVMGIKGLKSSKKGMAIAGIVICCVTLALTALNATIGAISAVRRYS